jgi:Acetylornithine deacetylase/Succinyl-diaminopimelate desuccinylase and related deacylases
MNSPIVKASASAAERVVEERVYCRSATGGGDTKLFRREGIPTVEFGFGTQTAHSTDEYTTATVLARNVAAYAALPYEYAHQLSQS